MFSSEFYRKCFQRPDNQTNLVDGIKTNLVDGIKTNLVDNLKSSLQSRIRSFLFGRIRWTITQGGFALFSSGPVGILILLLIVLLLVLLIIIWYFFFNDRNVVLAFYEWFGRGVTRFSGKVVWLVGATNGLGEAMALELATAGAKIILSARKKDILKKIKTDCIEKSKGKLSDSDIFVLPFDVTKMHTKYVQEAIDHFGKIDVFINNMGHMQLGEASEIDIELDKELLDVNFFGPVFLIKQVVKHFTEIGGGQIITISSLSGKLGIPGQASTSASMRALHGYLDALSIECKRYKISVTTVCTGLIKFSATDHAVLVGSSEITPEEMKKISRKGLKPKRCAHLVLVAGVNKCFEGWVSHQPFLFMVAVSQYFPGIHKCIMGYIFSAKRLEKIYEGKSTGMLSCKPLFVL